MHLIAPLFVQTIFVQWNFDLFSKYHANIMPSGELLAPGDHPSHATLQRLAQPGKGAHSCNLLWVWVMFGSIDALAYKHRRIKMYQILLLGEINLIISRTPNAAPSHIYSDTTLLVTSFNTLANTHTHTQPRVKVISVISNHSASIHCQYNSLHINDIDGQWWT